MDLPMMQDAPDSPGQENSDSQRLDDLEARMDAVEAKLGIGQSAPKPPAMPKRKMGGPSFMGE